MWHTLFRLHINSLVCVVWFFLSVPVGATPSDTLDLSKDEQVWLGEHDEITLAFDGNFPPYSFLNDQGEIEGLAVDIMALIGGIIGIHFKIAAETEWKTLYQSAQAHHIDVVATMVKRDSRKKWFAFTEPYIFKSLVIVTRTEDKRIYHKDDIADKTVALVRSYQYVNTVLDAYPKMKPFYVDDMLEGLNAVSVGKSDATVTFLGAGHYYRTRYFLSNLKYATVYDRQQSNERIAVRKDWPELASIMDKALASISESKLLELRAKWLPVDYMENLVELNLTVDERVWIRQHPVIRMGVDPEFAPFEYLEKKKYLGMASDYVKLLNQRTGLNFQLETGLGWKAVMKKAEQGEIDVLPAVGKTTERQRYLNYSTSYLSFHRVIVTREDEPFIAGLSDLDSNRVAVQEHSSHHGYLLENTDIEPVLFETLQASLLAVSGGKVQALVGNVASATYWIRKLNLLNLKIAAPISTDVQNLYFASRKDAPELASIIQKGLDTISPRQRKTISEKWLSLEYENTPNYTLIWRVVLIFSLVSMAIIFWNIMLNRTVRLRTSQLEYTAKYDQLTDLPNRFLILDRLLQHIKEGQRKNSRVALLSLDIDDFKKINDAFGHQVGDIVIKEIASRLKALLQDSDQVGRFGGDQFLIVERYLHDPSEAALLARDLISEVCRTVQVHGHEIVLNASIGIALFPDDGRTPEELLKHADTATHHAKERMQGVYAFYTENLMQKVSRKLELGNLLHGALLRKEFQVHYQPKVEASSGCIVSFESLLRWYNQDLGLVSPIEFIPIAERNGLIDNLGLFVLKQSLSTLSQWQTRFSPDLSMSINLSPVQFHSDELVPAIESLFLNYDIDHKRVEFELTESVLLAECPGITEKLEKLESLGVSLAMDDFGTGYSSMNYLRKYKFDTLKIDQEFIADLATENSDRKLVAATIAMAHELGMTVVAEGVETKEQQTFLIKQNCDFLQGWLFSKALPESEMTQMLEQQFGRNE